MYLKYHTLDTLNVLSKQRFRFIGSKFQLLPNIYIELAKRNLINKGNVFFDAFSGSAIVGAFFKKDFKIVSCDNLYFSYVLQNTLIVLNEIPTFEKLRKTINVHNIDDICNYLNSLPGREGFIYKNYTPASKELCGLERKYFSTSNGKKIDAIRTQLEIWHKSNIINKYEFYYLLTCLLFAVQKVANIAGTYGAFNKFWDKRALKPLLLKPITPIHSNFKHKAVYDDVFKVIDCIEGDISYLDPPYNSRQYIANYHLLETIAKYDSPNIKGVSGIRNYSLKEKSPFCSKKKAKSSLLNLCSKLKFNYVVISYNNEGILSAKDIEEVLLNASFRDIDLVKFPHRRFNSNRKGEKQIVYELLFIGRR